MAEGDGLQKAVGGISSTIIAALLIAAIGGLLILWRDVGIMQRRQETTLEENALQHDLNRAFTIEAERQKHIVASLERFKAAYDRREDQRDELFSKHFQLIIDLQQRQQSLADHAAHLGERLQQIEKQKCP